MSDRNEPVDVDVDIVIHTTEDAIKCDVGLKNPVWIPRSAIIEDLDGDINQDAGIGECGTMYIPRGLAEEKGII